MSVDVIPNNMIPQVTSEVEVPTNVKTDFITKESINNKSNSKENINIFQYDNLNVESGKTKSEYCTNELSCESNKEDITNMESNLVSETEDEFEISIHSSNIKQIKSGSFSSSSDNPEFNNTFGKTDEKNLKTIIADSLIGSEEQDKEHKDTRIKNILIEERQFRSDYESNPDKVSEFQHNIEVLDIKFDQDIIGTSSNDFTNDSFSNPENNNKSFYKEALKSNKETINKSHFSKKFNNLKNKLNKIQVVNNKEPEISNKQKIVNFKKKSGYLNIEISPLKQLLTNLKTNMFQSKKKIKKKFRFDRTNRFQSISNLSIHTTTTNLSKNKSLNTKTKKNKSQNNKKDK